VVTEVLPADDVVPVEVAVRVLAWPPLPPDEVATLDCPPMAEELVELDWPALPPEALLDWLAELDPPLPALPALELPAELEALLLDVVPPELSGLTPLLVHP
jgi:hypothetical protein